MKKNTCPFCFGHGVSKYWHDTGILLPDGSRKPVRMSLKEAGEAAYCCDRCGLPKELDEPPALDPRHAMNGLE